MKISKGIFAVVCIVFTIQIALVTCDQALGNRISSMYLNTIANRDRLLNGWNVGNTASFQIWIQGINQGDFNAVVGAVNGAGCRAISSNIGNAAKGLPHWNYVVARIQCDSNQKWQNLVYNQAFYARVAFTERSFSIEVPPPPRIALSPGYVNQHTQPSGSIFATDPDGVSGSGVNKLQYCQKFFPSTSSTRDYELETITTWRNAGNTGGPFTVSVMTTECVQPSNSKKKREVDEIPQLSQKEVDRYKELHANMMRAINEFNTTDQFKEDERKRQYCPEQYVRDQRIAALETEEEKEALRYAYQEECPDPGYPPYYPPPPPPPPPSDYTCTQVSQNQNGYLSCPYGKVIKKIIYSSYGNAPALTCDDGPLPVYGDCHSWSSSEFKANQMCCGRSSCTLPANSNFFDEVCWWNSKVLRVKAVCDWPEKAECDAPLCGLWNEGQYVSLSCPQGYKIKEITFAAYGSGTDVNNCKNHWLNNPGNYNCYVDIKQQVSNMCTDQNSCGFYASNGMFGDPCPGVVKKLGVQAVCRNHKPYVNGMAQSTSTQPQSNYNWEYANGRSWTNYMENMGWTSSVDYYNSVYGGTFYLLDIGVSEYHPELVDHNTGATRMRKLPNALSTDPARIYDGYHDPLDLIIYDEYGNPIGSLDQWAEENVAHGTTNAAILIGNELGLARTVPLYYAKVASEYYGLNLHAFENALNSVNQLVGTAGHNRPSVVVAPFFFNFDYQYCYYDKVNAPIPEPMCAQGLLDGLATAYDAGTIVVLPSGNGQDWWAMYVNPQSQTAFIYDSNYHYINYPNAAYTDTVYSATPLDICDTTSRQHNLAFNVWGLYNPVIEKQDKRPMFVMAHDYNNRISRWRDIVYSESDPDWENPWWSIGSSNVGSCLDFSSFGVQLSKTAANSWGVEDGHTFTSGYRTHPYLISGTSYATATAAAVAMHTYGRYGGQYYSGQNIENMRYYMKAYGNTNYDDVDPWRMNYWQDNRDARSYPRLKFF